MSLTKGFRRTVHHKCVQVEFGGLVLKGSARSIMIINQLMIEDPTLSFALSGKVKRTTVPLSVCYGALNLLVRVDASNFVPYACDRTVT